MIPSISIIASLNHSLNHRAKVVHTCARISPSILFSVLFSFCSALFCHDPVMIYASNQSNPIQSCITINLLYYIHNPNHNSTSFVPFSHNPPLVRMCIISSTTSHPIYRRPRTINFIFHPISPWPHLRHR